MGHVTACAMPLALWAAPGEAARYNQLSRAINTEPFPAAAPLSGATPQRRSSAALVDKGDHPGEDTPAPTELYLD